MYGLKPIPNIIINCMKAYRRTAVLGVYDVIINDDDDGQKSIITINCIITYQKTEAYGADDVIIIYDDDDGQHSIFTILLNCIRTVYQQAAALGAKNVIIIYDDDDGQRAISNIIINYKEKYKQMKRSGSEIEIVYEEHPKKLRANTFIEDKKMQADDGAIINYGDEHLWMHLDIINMLRNLNLIN